MNSIQYDNLEIAVDRKNCHKGDLQGIEIIKNYERFRKIKVEKLLILTVHNFDMKNQIQHVEKSISVSKFNT